MTKNLVRLDAAYEALAGRAPGVPGMGLVYGFTGAGKTTGLAWLVNRARGVYLRAAACWTPHALLGALMVELGAAPLARSAAMLAYTAQELASSQRPLVVDEADYLVRDPRMLDTLRDLHDLSGAPVVLCGMEGLERQLVHRPLLARRITQWVPFGPADREDARVLADTVCDVGVADDLLDKLHDVAKGSIGLMTVGLARIEAFGRAHGLAEVDAARWGGQAFFLGGPARRRARAEG
jgi:hypothetical protein